jgi:hypothetical protein
MNEYDVLVCEKRLSEKSLEEKIKAVETIDGLILRLREYKKAIQQESIIQIKEEHNNHFEYNDKVYFAGKKTTDRFASEEIIKCLSSDNEETKKLAIASLPKNPSFRKTEIKKLQEKLGILLMWQDVEEIIEWKEIPKILIKG